MRSINTSLSDLWAAGDLDRATARATKSTEKLSSGRRINRAGDDAAGLALGTRLEARVRADGRLVQGLNDGISYTQTAEGALQEIASLLQRARELAVQAASDALDDGQRSSLDREFARLRDEITRIARATQTFDRHPLADGTPDVPALTDVFPASGDSIDHYPSGIEAVMAIPAGATNVRITFDSYPVDDDLQIFTRDGHHLVGTPLSDTVWGANGVTAANIADRFLTEANGFQTGASYDAGDLNSGPASYTSSPAQDSHFNGMTLSYGGDPDASSVLDGNNNGTIEGGEDTREYFFLDQATEPLLVFAVGTGYYGMAVEYDPLPTEDPVGAEGELEVLAAVDDGSKGRVRVPKTPADAASLHLLGESIDTPAAARQALERLDQALDQVSRYRALYGARNEQMASRARNLLTETVNQQAARSRIEDLDYARETAALVRHQLLQEMASAALVKGRADRELTLQLLERAFLKPLK